ncbi:serine hydrolase domain-containing protein [Agrobacterium tumefaciens]|uniref:serine hydrolase domain-containing protein n=2 Tax=Rhizobium/Agrobacterium group TaxID=227290 RepID=UPI001885DCA9|nr:serine hydrolase [Agrobacterium tumefaciens]
MTFLRSFYALDCFCCRLFCRGVNAQPWQNIDPASAGWSLDKLKAAQDYATSLKPTAVMVVQDGKVIASWGDVSRKVNVASVCKSLLSAIYGIAVGERRIDLGSTLADFGIDDKCPALTATERRATIRDLLMARSGVYQVAAYETADIRYKRPVRLARSGSTTTGISALSARSTGSRPAKIFSRASRSASPCRSAWRISQCATAAIRSKARLFIRPTFHHERPRSRRFGQLFLNGGKWDGQQVIPAAWVGESTTALSQPSEHNSGYGYMWWTLRTDQWWPGSVFNAGYGGQVVAYVPEKRLVVVQTVDPHQNRRGIDMRDFFQLMRKIAAAAP